MRPLTTNERQEVLDFIDLFYPAEQKEVGDIHQLIYTQGQCFRFAQMLRIAFKQHSPVIVGTGIMTPTTSLEDVINEIEHCTYNHYYCKIGNECFDISGVRDWSDDDYYHVLVHQWRGEPLMDMFEECLDENKHFNGDWRCICELTDDEVLKVEKQLKDKYHRPDMHKWLLSVIEGFGCKPSERFLTARWLKHRAGGTVGNYKFTGGPFPLLDCKPVVINGVQYCDGGIAEDIYAD